MARMTKAERAAQEKRNARNAGRRAKRETRDEARRKVDNMIAKEATRQGFSGTLNKKQYNSVMKNLNKRAGFDSLMKTARQTSDAKTGSISVDNSET